MYSSGHLRALFDWYVFAHFIFPRSSLRSCDDHNHYFILVPLMLRLYLVYMSHVLNGLLIPDILSLLSTKHLGVASLG